MALQPVKAKLAEGDVASRRQIGQALFRAILRYRLCQHLGEPLIGAGIHRHHDGAIAAAAEFVAARRAGAGRQFGHPRQRGRSGADRIVILEADAGRGAAKDAFHLRDHRGDGGGQLGGSGAMHAQRLTARRLCGDGGQKAQRIGVEALRSQTHAALVQHDVGPQAERRVGAAEHAMRLPRLDPDQIAPGLQQTRRHRQRHGAHAVEIFQRGGADGPVIDENSDLRAVWQHVDGALRRDLQRRPVKILRQEQHEARLRRVAFHAVAGDPPRLRFQRAQRQQHVGGGCARVAQVLTLHMQMQARARGRLGGDGARLFYLGGAACIGQPVEPNLLRQGGGRGQKKGQNTQAP